MVKVKTNLWEISIHISLTLLMLCFWYSYFFPFHLNCNSYSFFIPFLVLFLFLVLGNLSPPTETSWFSHFRIASFCHIMYNDQAKQLFYIICSDNWANFNSRFQPDEYIWLSTIIIPYYRWGNCKKKKRINKVTGLKILTDWRDINKQRKYYVHC